MDIIIEKENKKMNKLNQILQNLKENLTDWELQILMYKYSLQHRVLNRYEIAEYFNIAPTRVDMYEKRIQNKLSLSASNA